jgi:hypothetical protein
MKWVNAIGLICQFFAFWFAAPELLGVSTLQRLEKGIERFAARAPLIIILSIIFGYGLTFIGLATYNFFYMKETGETFIDVKSYLWSMGICTVVYMVTMFNYKRLRRYLENKVAQPLTQRIINNSETRRIALLIGAVLFTLGFALQLLTVLLG